MLDELVMDLQRFADEDDEGSQTSAEDENTGDDEGQESNDQKMIPYWRFKEVNQEKNELQQKVNELQDKIENMDDPEKIKQELEQETEKLEQRNKEFLKQSELKVAALKEGVREEAVDDLIKIADFDDLEITDDNEVEGLDDLLEDMKEEKSYLFEQEDEGEESAGSDFKEGDDFAPEDEQEKKNLRKYFGITT